MHWLGVSVRAMCFYKKSKKIKAGRTGRDYVTLPDRSESLCMEYLHGLAWLGLISWAYASDEAWLGSLMRFWFSLSMTETLNKSQLYIVYQNKIKITIIYHTR